jgi:hypothetical protein
MYSTVPKCIETPTRINKITRQMLTILQECSWKGVDRLRKLEYQLLYTYITLKATYQPRHGRNL